MWFKTKGVCAAMLYLKKNLLMLTGFISYLHVFFSFCSKSSYPFWQTTHGPQACGNRRGVSSFAEQIFRDVPPQRHRLLSPWPVPTPPLRPQNAVTSLQALHTGNPLTPLHNPSITPPTAGCGSPQSLSDRVVLNIPSSQTASTTPNSYP